jgi:HTH-type transcriptional regulator/antitoxin HigA
MKARNKARILRKSLPATYDTLVSLHMPRPIHDEVGYANAVEMVDILAGHKLNADQDDYLQLLSQIIEAYEASILPALTPDSASKTLKFLLDENGMSGDDLATLLGIDRSSAFKILKGSRNLTLDHIRKLVGGFKVSADLFTAP